MTHRSTYSINDVLRTCNTVITAQKFYQDNRTRMYCVFNMNRDPSQLDKARRIEKFAYFYVGPYVLIEVKETRIEPDFIPNISVSMFFMYQPIRAWAFLPDNGFKYSPESDRDLVNWMYSELKIQMLDEFLHILDITLSEKWKIPYVLRTDDYEIELRRAHNQYRGKVCSVRVEFQNILVIGTTERNLTEFSGICLYHKVAEENDEETKQNPKSMGMYVQFLHAPGPFRDDNQDIDIDQMFLSTDSFSKFLTQLHFIEGGRPRSYWIYGELSVDYVKSLLTQVDPDALDSWVIRPLRRRGDVLSDQDRSSPLKSAPVFDQNFDGVNVVFEQNVISIYFDNDSAEPLLNFRVSPHLKTEMFVDNNELTVANPQHAIDYLRLFIEESQKQRRARRPAHRRPA